MIVAACVARRRAVGRRRRGDGGRASVRAPEDDADAVHDALQPDWQLELQSVVQSNVGGLVAHVVEQLDSHVDVHAASADAVHCASHVCSS
jgi:hypothetical protein